jgi:hypothetical protein
MADMEFFRDLRAAYLRANIGTLEWLIGRPLLQGVFLNTKQNSITLRDYDESDAWRGPGVLYGWIQGRGLEALIRHAGFLESERPELAERLYGIARPLYGALAELHARDGRAYFSYDAKLNPIYPGPDGNPLPQLPREGLSSYSDIFVLKGLIAASARFEPSRTPSFVSALGEVVAAVEQNRFVMDERQALRPEAAAKGDEYGPRMILLGAASLLRELAFEEAGAFGIRFIEHVLRHHVEEGIGTVRDVPGGDHSNPGHAIEFAGFSLECLPADADRRLIERLEQVLLRSFDLGFSPPGISLRVSVSGAEPPSAYRPWWSLPETIRAASLAYSRTQNPVTRQVWRRAHDAFFAHYWRTDPPIAYQTLTEGGPVDYVPATPDLDPGYHTGLSFLSAIHAIDAVISASAR